MTDKERELQKMIHQGFDVQRFYETIARIISLRENVKITVKVSRKETQINE